MQKPSATSVAIGCIVVVAISLWSLFSTKSAKINPGPFLGLGEVLAQETAKVLSGRGQIVLLVGTARNQSGTEQYYEVDGFLREVKKHPQLQITKTITHTFIETPTTDLGHDIRTFYEQLLNEHRDADALVTFIELPILTPEQPLDLPAAHPKILAAHMNITQGKTYLRDKLIVAFIANRENPPSSPPTGATTSREMFDKYYQLFTSANLDALD